ncbi:MAG TPA: TIGR03618 family F420-dependent PPOX class oxidoreductase [Actinomycetota bacterium]|jgi:PPOX class probable F420-dependent enzyme
MEEKVREFLRTHHGAIQTTLRKDGSPHVARIGIGLVDGKLWSSATQTRLRTKHLRRDPRSSLAVLNYQDTYSWLGLDCVVTILDGPDAVDQNLALYRVIAGKDPDDMDEYRAAMVADQRLIYEFEITSAYGL